MRRARLLPLLLVAALAPATAAAKDPGKDYSVGVDFPIFFGASPELMFGWGLFLEVTLPRTGIHSLRVGYESFGMGEPPGRSNASDWQLSYRYYLQPRPGSRLLPFFGGGLGLYSGGHERDANGQEIGSDLGGKPGLNAEAGFEVMFTPGLRGFGLRLSVNGVLHPDAQWVTFPMALLIWVL
jgi:hypothetical protein